MLAPHPDSPAHKFFEELYPFYRWSSKETVDEDQPELDSENAADFDAKENLEGDIDEAYACRKEDCGFFDRGDHSSVNGKGKSQDAMFLRFFSSINVCGYNHHGWHKELLKEKLAKLQEDRSRSVDALKVILSQEAKKSLLQCEEERQGSTAILSSLKWRCECPHNLECDKIEGEGSPPKRAYSALVCALLQHEIDHHDWHMKSHMKARRSIEGELAKLEANENAKARAVTFSEPKTDAHANNKPKVMGSSKSKSSFIRGMLGKEKK